MPRTRYTDGAGDHLEIVIIDTDRQTVLFKAIEKITDSSILVELDEDACHDLAARMSKHFRRARLADEDKTTITEVS